MKRSLAPMHVVRDRSCASTSSMFWRESSHAGERPHVIPERRTVGVHGSVGAEEPDADSLAARAVARRDGGIWSARHVRHGEAR